MRVRPAPASPLYPQLRFAFTDHPITVWAGAILLRLYFELLGLRAASSRCLGPLRRPRTIRFPPSTCSWPGGTDWRWAPNGLNI